MKKFRMYSENENRNRKDNRKVRTQSIKVSTEIKEICNDESYLESLFSQKKSTVN